MKRKKKGITPGQLVIGVVAIICIICIVFAVIKNKNNNNENNNGGTIANGDTVDESTSSYVVDLEGEENVKVNENGVKENTSESIKAEQDLDGIKISNADITYENGVSTIKADIKNDTGKDIEEVGVINIKIKDSEGTVVREMSTYIMGLDVGETKEIDASVTSEIVNATEIEFSR